MRAERRARRRSPSRPARPHRRRLPARIPPTCTSAQPVATDAFADGNRQIIRSPDAPPGPRHPRAPARRRHEHPRAHRALERSPRSLAHARSCPWTACLDRARSSGSPSAVRRARPPTTSSPDAGRSGSTSATSENAPATPGPGQESAARADGARRTARSPVPGRGQAAAAGRPATRRLPPAGTNARIRGSTVLPQWVVDGAPRPATGAIIAQRQPRLVELFDRGKSISSSAPVAVRSHRGRHRRTARPPTDPTCR